MTTSTTTANTTLDERGSLVLLHAKSQNVPPAECRRILGRIETAEDGPSGWSTVWRQEGLELLKAGEHAGAAARFASARFPFPDTDDGRSAQKLGVYAFGLWAADRGGRRIVLDVGGANVPVWIFGTPRGDGRVLLVCGGIVSVKEQWTKFVAVGHRLGLPVVLTELPGVGENPLPYDARAPRHLSELLDELNEHLPVRTVFAAAMSFGGTTALAAAESDTRIGSVFSVGPPIMEFFTDPHWWSMVPETTSATLAHTTATSGAELRDLLAGLALTEEGLRSLDIPVSVVVSAHDEIVPPADPEVLAAAVRHLRTRTFDDVHGSPAHLTDTALFAVTALTEFLPGLTLVGAAASLALDGRRFVSGTRALLTKASS